MGGLAWRGRPRRYFQKILASIRKCLRPWTLEAQVQRCGRTGAADGSGVAKRGEGLGRGRSQKPFHSHSEGSVFHFVGASDFSTCWSFFQEDPPKVKVRAALEKTPEVPGVEDAHTRTFPEPFQNNPKFWVAVRARNHSPNRARGARSVTSAPSGPANEAQSRRRRAKQRRGRGRTRGLQTDGRTINGGGSSSRRGG